MKNKIARSFYEFNYTEISNDKIFNSDAIIFSLEDITTIYNHLDKHNSIINKIKENNIEVYIKLDTKQLNKSFKELKSVDPFFINGFVLPNVNKSILNRMVVKVRAFEQKHKIDFGTLNFIINIDSPEAVENLRVYANYDRVKAIYIDEEAYLSNTGLIKYEKNLLRDQVYLNSILSKKLIIDSYYFDNDSLINDLEIGKSYGTSAKLTKNVKQIDTINLFFSPSESEIEEAKLIYEGLLHKTEKSKYFEVEDLEVSKYKLLKAQIVLSRSNLLQEELQLEISNEDLKDSRKILKPKKFYTLGEEVANAVSHGVGIILAIAFLVILLIKGRGMGFIPNLAYIIYSLSAFILYLASTLYHSLPLGSRAKRLFNKFDHLSIYLLIAGTYTPLTLIAVGGEIGIILFSILWVGALIGIMLKIFKFGKYSLVHMFLYVFLGWIAIFYIKTIFSALGPTSSWLILIGGIAYTVGILFYSLKLFKFTHMVWHLFVLAGTILHFFAIFLA